MSMTVEQARIALGRYIRPGKYERFVAPMAAGGALGALGGAYTTPPEEKDRRLGNMVIGALGGMGVGALAGKLRPFKVGGPHMQHEGSHLSFRQTEVRPWHGIPEEYTHGVNLANEAEAEALKNTMHESVGEKSLVERLADKVMGFVNPVK